MGEKNIDVDGVSADGATTSKAPETPMADARHVQPGSKHSDEMQFENDQGIARQDGDGFDVGLADDTFMDGGQP